MWGVIKAVPRHFAVASFPSQSLARDPFICPAPTATPNHQPGAGARRMSLKFKGEAPKKKRKDRPAMPEDDEEGDLAAAEAEYSADPISATGAITSSGVVVSGMDTDFAKELEVGDTILATVSDRFRQTTSDEARVVNMVLGKHSLGVNAPFSCDLTSATPFMVVKKKPDLEALRAARRAKQKSAKEAVEGSKTVTYKKVIASSGTFKKWETVTETASSMSREDMLNVRAKHKADRHC